MRLFRITLLQFQYVFEHPSHSFVYFLISIINPLVMIFFWIGALKTSGNSLSGLQLSSITSYYFLLALGSAFLMAHVENDVGKEDIKEGGLVIYLLKPFSYFWLSFIEEIPYRVLQGLFGVFMGIVLILFFGAFFTFSNSIIIIALSSLITVLAYMVSFTFKMIVGIIAFWLTDVGGFLQLIDAIIFVFAGFILPIHLFPEILKQITYVLPFPYMIYFPIVAFQGSLSVQELFRVIGMQCVWLIVFYFVYRALWNKGIQKFTGVGQ